MAQIDKPGLHFNTKLYSGNGSTNAQTGVGFQPDLFWCKSRSNAENHTLIDAVRGVGYGLGTNTTAAQYGSTNFGSFDSDGFTWSGNLGSGNENGQNYVAWNWKAGNSSGSANTDGGINSTVSVNNTAGFSVVKYGTGTGSATTVGHGLNAAPNLIIIKPLGTITTGGWIMGADAIDSTWNNVFTVNEQAATANDPSFNDTAPTNQVFSVGNNNTNRSGENYIAYCFVEKKGFSKFGSYTGNGNADGPFIYTGFKPAWVMYKRSSASGNDWIIVDNKRDPINVCDEELYANLNSAAGDVDLLDFTSNGFKLRRNHASQNDSGSTYFFMAFAENPIVGSNNIPAVAR